MKKWFITAFSFIFSFSLCSAADLSFRLMPSYNLLSDTDVDSAFAGTVSLDFSPVTFRGRDDLYAGFQGSWLPLRADGISDLNLFDGSFALGYNLRLLDQLSFALEGEAGVWTVPKDEENGYSGASGISYGGRFTAYYNAFPELSLGAFAGLKSYDGGDAVMCRDFELGLSVKYSFTKGLSRSSDIKVTEEDIQPVFPVFYSRYTENGFGKLTFVNGEKNDIKDVEVSVFIEQYMTNPETCAFYGRVKRGSTFDAELTCFLNESILNNLTAEKADAKVTVKYKSLGKRMTFTHNLELQALSRNSMTWEDDRRAAAFVSPRDGSASYFANYVKNKVKGSLKSGVPENIQYASAMFTALKLFGINYVVDPSSAFTDNTGTNQVDFLQFPYQTLLYSGGDCDDLSILNCALLEAIGIDTAFITCPGHIFIAFDAGVSPDNAAKAGDCVVLDGKVWVPLEITLCQDTFNLERSYAMREWKKYPEERKLIPLKEAWKEYKPVGIPDSSVKLEMPKVN